MPVQPGDTILGSDADDTLAGGDGGDMILGLDGDDSLVGAGGDDSLVGGAGGDTAGGTVYALTGDDAAIFDVDAETGDVSYKSWFAPSFDDVWDMNRDHIYDVSVIGSDDAGDEVSRTDWQLLVSETEALRRGAAGQNLPDGPSAAELTALLFTPMENEDEIPVEEDMEEPESSGI